MRSSDDDQRALNTALAATGIAYVLAIASWFMPQDIAAKAGPGVTCLAGVAVLAGVRFGWRTRRHFAARWALAALLLLVGVVTWQFLIR